LGLIVAAGIILAGCGPSNNSADQGPPYDRAKAAFQGGRLQRALDLTDKLAITSPPADSTERARVLRAVIYTGQLNSTKALAESYSKGADKAKNPDYQVAYRRLENDNLQIAEKAAMNLAETAHQIVRDGVIAKELTLEASFPTNEGPAEIKELATIEKGDWLEPDKEAGVAVDSLRKGISDALADVVGGDRAKAQQALAAGSTKLEGVAFALFLAKGLADGAVAFDSHHGMNPQRLNVLCDEGDDTLKAAQALLKDAPNKDQEKQIKKLQDRFKALRKDTSAPAS